MEAIAASETMETQMATTAALKPSVSRQLPSPIQAEATMTWTTPRVVEVSVGLEINSYARAELN
jgi:coenzyme PQQ precursor peptide PqqA